MSTRRSITLQEVAHRAAVSAITVSRVINGYEGVRPSTRDRVLAAVDELGYRPNPAARTLASRRSRAIGVLVPATTDFGPTHTLQAVERPLRDAGYYPLVTFTTIREGEVDEHIAFLLDHAISGLIVLAPSARMAERVQSIRAEIPVAVLQDAADSPLAIDQAMGGRLAAEHLIALGHRRIQLLAGPAGFFEATVRRDAAAAAIRSAGLPALAELRGDWSPASGSAAAGAIDPSATAVICGNDQMALGLIHALAARGVDVPGDVSVVGFDDIPEVAFARPGLTTIRQDFEEVGRRAVDSIISRIERIPERPAGPIAPELIVRDSTAPPR